MSTSRRSREGSWWGEIARYDRRGSHVMGKSGTMSLGSGIRPNERVLR